MSNDWQIVPKDDLRTVLALAWDAHPSRVSIETIWRIEKLLNAPASPVAVQMPSLTEDQREHLAKIAEANKYDPDRIIGGPPVAGDDASIVTQPITLHIEPREDGGLRILCDEIPGFLLSHRNHAALFSDLPLVIKDLTEHNGYRAKVVDDAATDERVKVVGGYVASVTPGDDAVHHCDPSQNDERMAKLERVYEAAKECHPHEPWCSVFPITSSPPKPCTCGAHGLTDAIAAARTEERG